MLLPFSFPYQTKATLNQTKSKATLDQTVALGMFAICHGSQLLSCSPCSYHTPSITEPALSILCHLSPSISALSSEQCSILRWEGTSSRSMRLYWNKTSGNRLYYIDKNSALRWRNPRSPETTRPMCFPTTIVYSSEDIVSCRVRALWRFNFFMEGDRTKKHCRVRAFSFIK